METVVLIIMTLVSFSLVLRLTCLPVWGRLIVCALYALLIGVSWEYAASQSKTQIADWLQNPGLMLDMAVLVTLDVVMQIGFCVINAKFLSGEILTKWEKIGRIVTLWIPGILILPTLFALLVEIIFSFAGVDFNLLAWSFAVVVLVAGLTLSYLIKRILPENDLRLELIFMVNALIAMLGIVATVNGRTAVIGTNDVRWSALLGIISLFVAGAAAGYLFFRRSTNKKISNFNEHNL